MASLAEGYQGRVVYIPLGREGLNYNVNPVRIPAGGLIQADGVVFTEDTIRKAPGRAKLGSFTTSVSPFSVASWEPTEGVQYLVVLASNGKLYINTAPTPTSIENNANVTLLGGSPPRAIMVPCGFEAAGSPRKLALFTGTAGVGIISGTSLSPAKLTGPPTDWLNENQPLNGVVHNGRLWGWGNANMPHAIYGSTTASHQDFTTSLNSTATGAIYNPVMPGVGLRLYCGHSFKGLLFLMKYPRGIYYYDDTDVNVAGWRIQQVTDSVGVAPTPYASVLLDDGILFMTAAGTFYLLTMTSQGGITLTDISARMNLNQWLQSNVNLTRLGQIVSVWNQTTKQAVFSVPATGSTTNNLLLTFDFRSLDREDGIVRFSYQNLGGSNQPSAIQCLAVRRNPTSYVDQIIMGDYATPGSVWVLDQQDRSINSALPGVTQSLAGYTAVFQLSHTALAEYYPNDPDIAGMMKLFDWVGIEYVPTGGGSITVKEYVDGVLQDTFTADLSPNGPRLATASGFTEFTLYSGSGSSTASQLGGVSTGGLALGFVEKRLVGTGRRISISIEHTSSNAANEDFSITGLYLGFREAGQDDRS